MTRDREAMTAIQVPSWVVPHMEGLRLAVRIDPDDNALVERITLAVFPDRATRAHRDIVRAVLRVLVEDQS